MMVFLPFIEHKTVTNFISTEQKILLPWKNNHTSSSQTSLVLLPYDSLLVKD